MPNDAEPPQKVSLRERIARLIAGAPVTNDVMKCQLKPVDTAAYAVKFSKSQQARLKKAFPGGVCDWSKPSVGYSAIKGTYQRY